MRNNISTLYITPLMSWNNDPTCIAISYAIMECDRRNIPVWYESLCEIMDGSATRREVSRAIDDTLDLCIIHGLWTHLEDGRWVRTLHPDDIGLPVLRMMEKEDRFQELFLTVRERIDSLKYDESAS